MSKRWGGLLILLAALFAAVIGLARPKIIGGSAEAGPIPGPPAVGECLTQRVAAVVRHFGGTQRVLPPAAVGVCDSAAHWGEVVSVMANGLSSRLPGSSQSSDPLDTDCVNATLQYQGIAPAQPDRRFGPWYPAADSLSLLVGPSDIQLAAGQRWAACVIAVGKTEPVSYTGLLRSTAVNGAFPIQMATCGNRLTPTAPIIWNLPCDEPHDAELFGRANVDPANEPTAAELLSTCHQLVQFATQTDDPTANGELELRVVTSTGAVITADRPLPDPTTESCQVVTTGNRTLVGPLLSLGGRAVPFR